MVVIDNLMKLDKDIYAIDKFSEQTKRIKSSVAYMLIILYSGVILSGCEEAINLLED